MTSALDSEWAEQKQKKLLIVVYALYAASFFTGISGVVGLIIVYVKQNEMAATWQESHCRWLRRTFWFGCLWMLIGAITAIVGVGVIVLVAASIWVIYRVVKGFLFLQDNKPVYPFQPSSPQPALQN